MPNWCSNCLSVRGTADSLREFARANVTTDSSLIADSLEVAAIAAKDLPDCSAVGQIAAEVLASFAADENLFSLAGVVPEPSWPSGSDAWYEWRIENWGIKWDAASHAATIHRTPDSTLELRYEFDTPWGPPHVWFVAAAARFAELDLQLWWNEEQSIGGVLRSLAGSSSASDNEIDSFDGAPPGWKPPYGLQDFWDDEES